MIMRESARRRAWGRRVLTPVLGAVAALALASPAAAQFSARFSAGDVLGTDGGAAGSSGGTIYPFPNPYMPRTLAPRPELSGNYATPYLYSPSTGQTYADPMYYHALRALERWDGIQSASRPVLRPSRPASAGRAAAREETRPASAPSSPRMPSLREVLDK